MAKELFTVVTRKGQITLPAEIRRFLGIQEGDRIAVSLVENGDNAPRQAIVRPVRSVAERTFGAVPPRKRPEDFEELRRHFEEGIAQESASEAERG